MNSKFFKIGDVVFELKSESAIADSTMFNSFKTNSQKADVVIKILNNKSIEIKGRLIGSYSNKEIYEYNGKKHLYSFYPECGSRKIYYACSYIEKNLIIIEVDFERNIYDSMLFDAFDFPDILIKNNSFLFHCSFISISGKAILFSGKSGCGKSTQADLWKKYKNAEIINGDRAVLKLKGKKLFAYGTPYCGSSKISVNKSAEVAAIIFPEHSAENSIEKLNYSFDAVPLLLSQLTFENNENTLNVLMLSEKIFNYIPMFKQSCVPDRTAVETADAALKALGIL